MRRLKKVLLGFLAAVALLVAAAVAWVEVRWNHRYEEAPGPDLHASTDPAVIARGKYLVRGPAHCSNCHVASWDEMARADRGEQLPLRGGLVFALPFGTLYSKNLTPDKQTGIGRYPDSLIFRMMRHSIKPDGTSTLALLMPFHQMADDDLIAVVSYLRSLEPIRNEVPEVHYSFLGKAVRTFAPIFRPVLGQTAPQHAPPEAPTRERGEYLARFVANCSGCHTKTDLATGRIVGPAFGGGMEFEPMPPGFPGSDRKTWFRSPNLTTDASGIMSNFPTREEWIQRFRLGRVLPGTPMHWGTFSRMSDADLEALWIFFRGLPPITNEVGTTAFTPQS